MNWDAIGAVGQMVSALALIVVIVQVRLSASETLRSIREGRSDDLRRTLMDQAHSEFLNRVLVKGFRAFDDEMPFIAELIERGLAPEEAAAFEAWLHSWFIADTQHITQIDKLTTAERHTVDFILRAAHQGGARARYLEANRDLLNPDAIRYIDNLLAQPVSAQTSG